MNKTIRILAKERMRLNRWRKFLRIFKAYKGPVPGAEMDKFMGWK